MSPRQPIKQTTHNYGVIYRNAHTPHGAWYSTVRSSESGVVVLHPGIWEELALQYLDALDAMDEASAS